MDVYVVISQPDGDWTHYATFLGVYSTQAAAEVASTGWKTAVIIKCAVDVTPTSFEYARSNVAETQP